MTLDDLRVFITVYETGNLSAVARTLSCTQSAVSQHIKRLEKETVTWETLSAAIRFVLRTAE